MSLLALSLPPARECPLLARALLLLLALARWNPLPVPCWLLLLALLPVRG